MKKCIDKIGQESYRVLTTGPNLFSKKYMNMIKIRISIISELFLLEIKKDTTPMYFDYIICNVHKLSINLLNIFHSKFKKMFPFVFINGNV